MKKILQDFIFSKYPDKRDGGIRYDIHFNEKNVAYALTLPSKQKDGSWLEALHVLPRFQKKGLATFLIEQVEKDNKEKVIRLRARPYKSRNMGIKALRNFYQKLGYKEYEKGNKFFKKLK
jgi:GNAT superfamily N-acetyltransferase